MAVYKVVFDNSSPNRVEYKITPESGNNHLVYLLQTGGSLIWNADGIGETDWINPTDGLAQYWTIDGGA